jgi:hypothetical protein
LKAVAAVVDAVLVAAAEAVVIKFFCLYFLR